MIARKINNPKIAASTEAIAAYDFWHPRENLVLSEYLTEDPVERMFLSEEEVA